MIQISEAASKRIEETSQHWEKPLLRLEVKSGGCSGFMYKFSLVERAEDDDEVCGRLVIDPVSAPFLDGATLDLKKDLMEEKFVIINPNATRKCGCGESFCA